MFCPTCSPLGARNPIFFANLKILVRFDQILSYDLTLRVTSPPILTRSFDPKPILWPLNPEIECL